MPRFLPFFTTNTDTPFSLELLLFIYNRRKLFKSFVYFKRDILNASHKSPQRAGTVWEPRGPRSLGTFESNRPFYSYGWKRG